MSDQPDAKHTDLRRKVVHALTWTAGTRLAGQAFTWAITIVVMRLLQPEDYGLLAMATIFVALFSMFSELGLGPALIQSREVTDLQLSQTFGTVLVLNAGLFLMLFLLAPLFAAFFDEPRLVPIVRVLAVQFLIGAFVVIPSAVMQRKFELKAFALVDFGGVMVTSFTTLASALAGLGAWALVIGSLTAAVYRAVAVNVRCPYFVRPRFALPAGEGILKFGVQTALSRLIFFLYSQTDMLIAGKMLGKEALGYYSVGVHLASLPVQKTAGMMFAVAFPTFARIQGDRELVRRSVLKAVRILSLLAFPVLFGMSAVSRELVLVLLGPNWASAIISIQFLALIMPLRSISTLLFAVSDGLGRADVTLKSSVVMLLVIPAALIVASPWGLTGFCVAWVIAYPVVFLSNAAQTTSIVGLSVRALLGAIIRPACAASGMYLAVSGARMWWPWEHRMVELMVFLVLTGAIVYGVLSLAINRHGCIEAWTTIRNRG